jgi:hypothetical protein
VVGAEKVTINLSQKSGGTSDNKPRFNLGADAPIISSADDGLAFPNFFEVFVDGVWQPSAAWPDMKHSFGTWNSDAWFNNNVLPVVLADGLDPSSSHDVTVVKSTEAMWNSLDPEPNYMTLYGVELSGPSSPSVMVTSKARSKKGALLSSSRKLEFLGDSITAGYCNLCHEQPAYPTGAVAESSAESWPSAVAALTSAEFHAVAWSGYGLTHNCCGGSTLMPAIYTRALASVPDGSADWNFSSWIPDAVVVNLGKRLYLLFQINLSN